MKKINVRFEKDETTEDIDIVIRAKEKDDQITALIEKLNVREPFKLTVMDRDNCSCVIDEEEIVFASADGSPAIRNGRLASLPLATLPCSLGFHLAFPHCGKLGSALFKRSGRTSDDRLWRKYRQR